VIPDYVPVVPDYIHPVVGWRMWFAAERSKRTRLISVVQRTIWPAHKPLVAECRRLRLPVWPFARHSHDAPGERCACGIYATDMETVQMYLPQRVIATRGDFIPVVGRVSLWGVVHEHECGWRASCAYPISLFVPVVDDDEWVEKVIADLRRYGVPVTAVGATTREGLIEEVGALAA
jgi:hypothetical protein